jgi:anti-sigma regulatory factor (Ser/Thr protein kinase)
MVTQSGDSFRYRREEIEISRARGDLRRSLSDRRLRAGLVDDLALVVVELVSNAVEHGMGRWVDVQLDVGPTVVSISVINAGRADLGDPSSWTMPPPGSISGRGLALVRRLVDDVEWSTADDQLRVRADRRHEID